MATADLTMVIGPHPGPVDAERLAAAYPWPADRRWIRAQMVLTLDGASRGRDGLSGSISSPADSAIFAETRRLCDTVLVGGGTIRAEHYQAMKAKPEQQQARVAEGLAAAPLVVIVSGRLDLPWEDALFSDSAQRPLVVTSDDAAPDALAIARDHAEVVSLGSGPVDPDDLVALLDARGLRRITCEGGPHLLGELARAGHVDEADISIAPLIVGGGQIVTGVPGPIARGFDLVHVIAAEGYLFGRYVAR